MTLTFDPKLYTQRAVREAARRLTGWGRFEVEEGPRGIRVRATGVPAELRGRLPGEFGNAALLATRRKA
jgi:hypothetical protein